MTLSGPQALHQWAYDYLWDRWGLYVGTFRTLIIVLAFSDNILVPVYQLLVLGEIPLWVVIVRNLLSFSILWFFFAREHLGEEWNLQHQGRLEALNAKTLGMGWVYAIIRVAIVLLFVYEVDLATQSASAIMVKAIADSFMVSWTFACCVLVRERDPLRFARAVPNAA